MIYLFNHYNLNYGLFFSTILYLMFQLYGLLLCKYNLHHYYLVFLVIVWLYCKTDKCKLHLIVFKIFFHPVIIFCTVKYLLVIIFISTCWVIAYLFSTSGSNVISLWVNLLYSEFATALTDNSFTSHHIVVASTLFL